MKYLSLLFVVLLVGCGPATQTAQSEPEIEVADADGCSVKSSSRLANEHKVGPITNLVKDETEWGMKNECNVKFDITVNGEIYHLEGSETGLEQMASVCRLARDKARRDLLLDLGGKFQTESTVKCRKHESV